MSKILVLNGPNLNLLGKRQPEIYGRETLSDIQNICEAEASKLNLELSFTQSNSEQEIIEQIQDSLDFDAIIINAAAFTHTSVAIMDALLARNIPVIEVHLSNIYKREEFRHKSYISNVAEGVICGFGSQGYAFAVQAVSNILAK